MRFRIEQHLAAPVERVEAALLDPAWYEALTASPAVWAPELLEVTDADGSSVGLRVRYRFRGTLNPAAAKVVSPAKLSWVEVSTLDRGTHTINLRIEPDNYADRLRFTGTVELRRQDRARRLRRQGRARRLRRQDRARRLRRHHSGHGAGAGGRRAGEGAAGVRHGRGRRGVGFAGPRRGGGEGVRGLRRLCPLTRGDEKRMVIPLWRVG